mmetsp:Transcript_7983/g.12063  ORF Transcript_7983/g.12063 Transcript_7983/m.12063 type:complete len:371 (+) Transcript_7983:117-1229(+)
MIRREEILKAILFLICFCESIALTIYNKYLFSGPIKAPLFVTAVYQVFCFIGAVLVWGFSRREFYTRTKIPSHFFLLRLALFPIGILLNSGLNNLSLKYLVLDLNQLIRLCSPVILTITSCIFMRKVPAYPQIISQYIIVTGVSLGLATSYNLNVTGMALCFGSVVGRCVSLVLRGLSFGNNSSRFNMFDILLYVTVPTAALLSIWSLLMGEYEVILEAAQTLGQKKLFLLLLIGGMISLSYNIATATLVKFPATKQLYQISGGVRAAVLIVLSFFFFTQELSSLLVVSYSLAVSAFLVNSFLSQKENGRRLHRRVNISRLYDGDDTKHTSERKQFIIDGKTRERRTSEESARTFTFSDTDGSITGSRYP